MFNFYSFLIPYSLGVTSKGKELKSEGGGKKKTHFLMCWFAPPILVNFLPLLVLSSLTQHIPWPQNTSPQKRHRSGSERSLPVVGHRPLVHISIRVS